MTNRNFFEAVNCSLQDILQIKDPRNFEKTFGGNFVVLGGDFRQVLPVVKKGRREDVIQFTIYQLHLWNCCHVFKLQQNMRLM